MTELENLVRGLALGDWLEVAGSVFGVALVTWLLAWQVGRRLRGRTSLGLHGLERLAAPLSLLATVLILSSRSERAPPFLSEVVETLAIVGAFWLAARTLDVVWMSGRRSARLRKSPAAGELLLAGRYLGRLVLVLTLVGVLVVRFGAARQLTFVLTALTAALAFAARDPIRNAIAFVTMIFDTPFHIGDRVRLVAYRGGEDVVGEVIDITLMSTTVLTNRQTRVSVSNVSVGQLRVENLSVADRRWLELAIPVPSELTAAEIRVACDAIQADFEGSAHLAEGRPPRVWLSGFDATTRLKAAVWLGRSADRRAAQHELLLMMRARLERPAGEQEGQKSRGD